jgi:MinD-like ATPase involved in chromosome partitioning or flagellar assembly
MKQGDPQGYGAEAPVDLTQTRLPARARPPDAVAPVHETSGDGDLRLMISAPSVGTDPATWGWRGRAWRWTGGLIKPKPGSDETRHRQAELAVQQHLGGSRLVMVANPKGGSMVSTTALMLAHTFASLRGGSVVAWDNNESHGTLGQRAEVTSPATHVWHLLNAFDRLVGPAGTAGDISHYLRSQPSRAEVLASDTDPRRLDQISNTECGRIEVLLTRHFRLTVMDTGNNMRASNWRWAAGCAHQLVVPIRLDPDVAQTAAWMLDGLAPRRPDLVAGAVVLLGPSATPPPAALRERMVAYFAGRCSSVVEVPFDPQLAGGRPIVYARINRSSFRAWVTAAAAVADRLAAVHTTRPDQLAQPATAGPPPAPAGGHPAGGDSGEDAGGSITDLPARKAQGQ